MLAELSKEWHSLESSRILTDSGWRLKYLPYSTADGNIAIAIDELEQRHLLIPISAASSGCRDGKTLSCWAHKLNVENQSGEVSTHLFLDICCENNSLNRQFNHVVVSIIAACRDKIDAEIVARAEVIRWRRLFAGSSEGRDLSFKDQLAVFGELTTLKTLQESLGEFDPLWWTGPNGDSHDFELPNFHLEVKTAARNSKSVTIHSLSQLNQSNDLPLYLVLQFVAPDPDGQSISELLLALSDRLEYGQDLIDQAALAGIRFSANEEKFSAIESRIVEVNDKFPRIVPGNLTEETCVALGNMKYDLVINRFKGLMMKFDGAALAKVRHHG